MLKGYCTALVAVHATTGNALPFPLRCQHPQPRFCRTLLSNRKDKSNFGFPRKSPLSGQPHNTDDFPVSTIHAFSSCFDTKLVNP